MPKQSCPNCKRSLGCGCQKKTASDGKQGCKWCIPVYEKKLKPTSGAQPWNRH